MCKVTQCNTGHMSLMFWISFLAKYMLACQATNVQAWRREELDSRQGFLDVLALMHLFKVAD